MDIKQTISDLAIKHGRTGIKNEETDDSLKEAEDAESKASKAKDAKDFDKFKKQCLTSVDAAEKAAKAWKIEMVAWDAGIQSLEKEVAAEKDKIAQQQKEADAVSKAIDEINAEIKAHNDKCIGKERSPFAKPYIPKKDTSAKLASATAALAEPAGLATNHRKSFTTFEESLPQYVADLKKIKDRVSKSKFKAPKK